MADDSAEAKDGRRLGDAAARLTEDTTELVRQQLREVREELTATLQRAGIGAGLLGGAALCGGLAVAAAHQTALRGLERVLPRASAAAVLCTVYGATGATLAVIGLKKLRAVADVSDAALDQARRSTPGEPGAT
ncbi:phage holin family protein [Streptomyces sp. NPDC051320]|uniref:phage holin family protein n=1 Tax=Streptomyces sp. NPDC051320 TaxID=3154644 RepID=UPI0034446B69